MKSVIQNILSIRYKFEGMAPDAICEILGKAAAELSREYALHAVHFCCENSRVSPLDTVEANELFLTFITLEV